MDFRKFAATVMVSGALLWGLCGPGPVSAADSKTPEAAGPVAFTKKVSLDKPGTLYLTMRADVPSGPGARRLGYTVWVQGKMLKYPKDQAYDGVFDPYFAIGSDGPKGWFIFLLPLRLSAGESAVEVRSSEGGKVEDVRLRPALDGVTVSAEFPGSVDGVYFPQEKPRAAITFRAAAGTKIAGRAIVQLIRVADGDPDDFGPIEDRVVQAAKVGEKSIALTADGSGAVTLDVELPDNRHGLYGVTVLLEQGDQLCAQYVGAAAIVPRRDEGRFNEAGKFMASLSHTLSHLEQFHPRAFKRLGFDWVRTEIGWGGSGFEGKKSEFDWRQIDAFHDRAREAKLSVMNLMQGAPEWARPAGGDQAPATAHLDDWKNAWQAYMQRYKDVVRGANVWNEPWEGGGISGWGSTGEHYRQLVRRVREARDAVDKGIKVICADSAHNTLWKMYAAGRAEDIDVISTHYEKPALSIAYGLARTYGDEVWDTESWMNYRGDANALRYALWELAHGARLSSAFDGLCLYDDPRGLPNSNGVVVAAVQHLIGDLEFDSFVHPHRPPYVMLWKGKDRHVAIVITHVGYSDREWPGHPHWRYAHQTATMELPQPGGRLAVYDTLANPVDAPEKDGRLHIPVHGEPTYVEFRGDLAAFRKALEGALYRGFEPVQIVLKDLAADPGRRPDLEVRLQNIHPIPLRGTLRAAAEGLKLENATRPFALAPEAVETFTFSVAGATGVMEGYPVTVTAETDLGNAQWTERISVAVIGRGAPQVDGDLADWQQIGALPVFLTNSGEKIAGAFDEQKPWVKYASGTYSVKAAFAADDKCLYMMARVYDPAPPKQRLPSALRGQAQHRFKAAPADHVYDAAGPFYEWGHPSLRLSLGPVGDKVWDKELEQYPADSPQRRFGACITAPYQYTIFPAADGQADLLRFRTPEFRFVHPLPLDYGWIAKNCRVEGAQYVVKCLEDGFAYELALPWSELKLVPHKPGDRIRLAFEVWRDNDKNVLEWSKRRSATGLSALDWSNYNSNYYWDASTEWTFGPGKP